MNKKAIQKELKYLSVKEHLDKDDAHRLEILSTEIVFNERYSKGK